MAEFLAHPYVRFVNEAILVTHLPPFPHVRAKEQIERLIDFIEEEVILEKAEEIKKKRELEGRENGRRENEVESEAEKDLAVKIEELKGRITKIEKEEGNTKQERGILEFYRMMYGNMLEGRVNKQRETM